MNSEDDWIDIIEIQAFENSMLPTNIHKHALSLAPEYVRLTSFNDDRSVEIHVLRLLIRLLRLL
jgi:hypothetical protein